MTDLKKIMGEYFCQATPLPAFLTLLQGNGTGMILWELTLRSGLFSVLAPTHSL